MASTAALIWYLVIAGPQGGMAILPGSFDKREKCMAAIAEYHKQPTPSGWTVQSIPSASPFATNGSTEQREAVKVGQERPRGNGGTEKASGPKPATPDKALGK